MSFRLRSILLAAAPVLILGCDTGPPGGGITNVQPPVSGSPEKAAERTDLPTPSLPSGDAPLADSASMKPGVAPEGSAKEAQAPADAGAVKTDSGKGAAPK